jgi:hypothetical protein
LTANVLRLPSALTCPAYGSPGSTYARRTGQLKGGIIERPVTAKSIVSGLRSMSLPFTAASTGRGQQPGAQPCVSMMTLKDFDDAVPHQVIEWQIVDEKLPASQ